MIPLYYVVEKHEYVDADRVIPDPLMWKSLQGEKEVLRDDNAMTIVCGLQHARRIVL